ncbi:MAG: UDP-N-acetylglucosamine 2-epimerase (non-hydrolyzing) [Myxococcales bacterium]|nr:UDP-N-acetylglucosamine 2-epimerase (non-hydrolyzing) [Myxococcales bacterium]MCB9539186.1 UDP-N-acetylglucosamine 2-epimerase (non-hydrolyzing) [Myxococcales bacterium]
MRIVNVVGARPNFMKIAPLMAAYGAHPGIEPILVHTGQHYDHAMSTLFFEELGIPRPDVNLGVHGGSHAVQHAEVMRAFEGTLADLEPDLVVVVGDVNSTISCALVAAKAGVAVAHVEAGLRSFDRTMPEEINRVLTDQLSDLLFVSEQSGLINLAREGLDHEGVHFVGNVMIDSLYRNLPKADASSVVDDHDLTPGQYAVLTMHRPANVDDPRVLGRLLGVVERVAAQMPIVFPAHPRTLDRLAAFGLRARLDAAKNITVVKPLGYLDFLKLVKEARIILTDSGGIQEETTVLRVPCVTLRESTERPSTCLVGTNRLAGTDPARVWAEFEAAMASDPASFGIPAKWDGRAAERIAAHLAHHGGLPRAHRHQHTAHGALARLSRVD